MTFLKEKKQAGNIPGNFQVFSEIRQIRTIIFCLSGITLIRKTCEKNPILLFQYSKVFLTLDKLFIREMYIAMSFNKIPHDKPTQKPFSFNCNFSLPAALKEKIKEEKH